MPESPPPEPAPPRIAEPDPPPAPRRRPLVGLQLLAETDFRRVWTIGIITGTMRWLEILASSIWVVQLSGSAFQVALVLFVRSAPMILLGAVIGALAERVDRKRLLAGELAAVALSSVVLWALAASGALALWHVCVGAFVGGIYFATDLAVRRTVVGEVAGPDRVGGAMALESLTTNLTRMLGPFAGGLVYQALGLAGAYALGIAFYTLGVVLLLRARFPASAAAAGEAPPALFAGLGRTLAEGLRYVRTERVVLAALAITAIVNLWGFPYSSMVAVIGEFVLALEPADIGLLMSAEGIGAFLGAVTIVFLAPTGGYARLFHRGSLAFLAAVFFFSLSETFALSFLALFLGGFGVAVFSAMQATIVLSHSRPEMRARAMGVLAVCIGTGPIGILHVGLMAEAIGAPLAILVIAVEGLVALVVAWLVWPEIR